MKKKINNGIFYVVISLVAVLAIGSLAAIAYNGYGTPKVVVEGNYIESGQSVGDVSVVGDENLGAVSGPDTYQWMNFHAGFQSGGTVQATTTTAATYTLTTGDIKPGVTWLAWTPNISTTVTTMASSSVAMDNLGIPNIGDTRKIYLYNASTTVISTITLAAGTGVDLQKNEDTANLATAGTSVTELTFIRKPDTDVMVIMDQWDVAD